MKTCVITGASDGIGAEMARQLAARGGVSLVLAARNADRLAAVAAQCERADAPVLAVPTDVALEAQCRALIDAAVARFGRLDALVNNAGISAQALLEQVRAEDLHWYEDLMRVNLWGSVWCTHAALPHLKAARGQLVAVSSLAGLVGVPGRTAYSASKFAMTGFFEALRAELKPAGVAVTIAYPGVVATRIRHHGLNARGEPAGSSGLKEDKAMSVEECARLIIRGMDLRQREVVMTAQGRLGRWLKLIAPGKVEDLALAALKHEVRPY
ncbi:SDR family oxidoreductase [Ramlibacter tataouinensis]|uniref:Dehydrogenases with different specificities (Related to short-chain alcohol dehydrogenases)-like protein n=1 Tax=Ramlibacter tataouinensis (strain ATCC BAA-407 / DSM 14655 / LMG 21543 / TTB310) TaxID=365046 RepID=F5Y2X0_RAMTT|nr:SDR family oxidoreductase [Ramlibacter tataouinensis]AEG93666.1 dehydrogenases with different specificities (related to short-chain alcohol dehydrogenases)-like protein [Ramlibacter tataouinensis TTB310]